MIYTASYFTPETHHGALVPISRSVPSQYKALNNTHSLQPLLAPSADLLKWWKKQEKRHKEMGWDFPSDEAIAQYTAQYREEIRANKDPIFQYLLQVDSSKDETWLCWEKPGEFCHRNLAYELAAKVRPDCVGGKDIEVVETVEIALPKCLFEVGDRVTNESQWHGNITKIEDCPTCEGGLWILVHWQERENHKDKLVAKQPIIGHLISDLKKIC